jgi:PAS domain S-box-containing protein
MAADDKETIQTALAIQSLQRPEEAQNRLAAIVESSNDAIISKTLEGIITSWNKGAERIFGYTTQEAVGQHITLLIPPDRHGEEEMILAQLRRGERIEHYETVRRRKDGKEVDISLTISPIKDASGRIIGASKIARDISEQKNAWLQLEAEREALEIINRVGQMLSAELDLGKLVQAFTDAATEITGAQFGSFFYNVVDERGGSYLLHTLSGVPRERFAHFPMPRATDLFGPTFRGEGVIRIADVKQDPRYGNNPPYYGMPQGHLPVASYLAVPVVSRSGEVIGGLFFGHSKPDVFTERHERIVSGLAGQAAIAMDNARLYEAAQKARREAETANRLKDEFLTTVSHELRTPLNAIFGWARMLRNGRLDPGSVVRAIETIERNARTQEQIIEDILDVSRIVTGKIRLEVSTVEIASVIEAAVDTLRPTADTRGVRLQTVLDSGPNLVYGDTGRLQQIIWNLLTNAIKFTPRNGRVQVTLERTNSNVEIKVVDTGRGISKEFLPYVFERFRQADSSTTREYGGIGLGLAIVRHLVELHGGSVSADSPGEGQGATFTVRLPLAVIREDHNQGDQPGPHLYQTVAGDLSVESEEELAGVRVLVVDDEADARDLLTVILLQCGAEVRAANSTSQGLEAIKEWRPDVLVSDIGMPGHDGFELIQSVRALELEQGRDTPAIALTAYARSEDKLKALRSGFQTHVAKPVEPAELVATIAGLARSYRHLK